MYVAHACVWVCVYLHACVCVCVFRIATEVSLSSCYPHYPVIRINNDCCCIDGLCSLDLTFISSSGSVKCLEQCRLPFRQITSADNLDRSDLFVLLLLFFPTRKPGRGQITALRVLPFDRNSVSLISDSPRSFVFIFLVLFENKSPCDKKSQ